MRKNHFKMYKSGKRWVTAMITVTTLVVGGDAIAHADTTSTSGDNHSSQLQSSSVMSISTSASSSSASVAISVASSTNSSSTNSSSTNSSSTNSSSTNSSSTNLSSSVAVSSSASNNSLVASASIISNTSTDKTPSAVSSGFNSTTSFSSMARSSDDDIGYRDGDSNVTNSNAESLASLQANLSSFSAFNTYTSNILSMYSSAYSTYSSSVGVFTPAQNSFNAYYNTHSSALLAPVKAYFAIANAYNQTLNPSILSAFNSLSSKYGPASMVANEGGMGTNGTLSYLNQAGMGNLDPNNSSMIANRLQDFGTSMMMISLPVTYIGTLANPMFVYSELQQNVISQSIAYQSYADVISNLASNASASNASASPFDYAYGSELASKFTSFESQRPQAVGLSDPVSVRSVFDNYSVSSANTDLSNAATINSNPSSFIAMATSELSSVWASIATFSQSSAITAFESSAAQFSTQLSLQNDDAIHLSDANSYITSSASQFMSSVSANPPSNSSLMSTYNSLASIANMHSYQVQLNTNSNQLDTVSTAKSATSSIASNALVTYELPSTGDFQAVENILYSGISSYQATYANNSLALNQYVLNNKLASSAYYEMLSLASSYAVGSVQSSATSAQNSLTSSAQSSASSALSSAQSSANSAISSAVSSVVSSAQSSAASTQASALASASNSAQQSASSALSMAISAAQASASVALAGQATTNSSATQSALSSAIASAQSSANSAQQSALTSASNSAQQAATLAVSSAVTSAQSVANSLQASNTASLEAVKSSALASQAAANSSAQASMVAEHSSYVASVSAALSKAAQQASQPTPAPAPGTPYNSFHPVPSGMPSSNYVAPSSSVTPVSSVSTTSSVTPATSSSNTTLSSSSVVDYAYNFSVPKSASSLVSAANQSNADAYLNPLRGVSKATRKSMHDYVNSVVADQKLADQSAADSVYVQAFESAAKQNLSSSDFGNAIESAMANYVKTQKATSYHTIMAKLEKHFQNDDMHKHINQYIMIKHNVKFYREGHDTVLRYRQKPILRALHIEKQANGLRKILAVYKGKLGTLYVHAKDYQLAYYQNKSVKQATHKTHDFTVKVISPIREYRTTKFTHYLKRHHVGQVLSVNRVAKYKGITRFQLSNGHYISSNAYFVKVIK